MRHAFIPSFIILTFFAVTSPTFATERYGGTTIRVEKAAHFLVADGSDVLIQPGTYIVEAAEEWLRLFSGERRDALLLEAMGTHHLENLTEAKAGLHSGEANEHRIVLLLPGGKGLEAIGSVSGVRSRASKRQRSSQTWDRRQQASRIPIQLKNRPVVKKTKPIPRSPEQPKNPLAQRVQKLELRVNSLQTAVDTLQGQLTTILSAIQVNNAGEITIGQASPVTIQGSTIDINADFIDVQSGMSRFSGVVQADTLITNSVISNSYTPGAGNIW